MIFIKSIYKLAGIACLFHEHRYTQRSAQVRARQKSEARESVRKKFKLSENLVRLAPRTMKTKKTRTTPVGGKSAVGAEMTGATDASEAADAAGAAGAAGAPRAMSRYRASVHKDLSKAMRMDDTQSATLAALLSNELQVRRARGSADEREEYFGFWGFAPCEFIRDKIMYVVQTIFQPRMLYASFTNGPQFEGICIIKRITAGIINAECDKSRIKAFPSTNEDALLFLLELFNMSAGVVRFETMLNAPMISSIDRIDQTPFSSYGNLKHHSQSDFYELFKCKRSLRDDNASAKILTGYDLSTDSICRLTRLLKSSETKNQNLELQISYMAKSIKANETELRALHAREGETRRNDAARFNTARLIVALKNIGDIQEATAAKLLQALRLRTVPVNELVKMRFGEGSQGACSNQEIVVHDAPLALQILQRPVLAPRAQQQQCHEDSTEEETSGQEVAT